MAEPFTEEHTAWERVRAARVAHLATVTTDGSPHLVPCCFVLGESIIHSAVDAKPKSTLALKRLGNIAANPTVALLVDHYEEDWSALWWVRIDGEASLVNDPTERQQAISALAAKYPQYRSTPPPGEVIAIGNLTWHTWQSKRSR